ncbi:MAG: glycosyltransferase [Oscillospiraceae bacterium]|jgi:glycosyltransferase involved in cell wall biosynthesis|nr:glycosyltransferase [Oscillospiraceae bacterium]
MKAHMVVTRAGAKSEPFNGHPIRLTVGLIVKNEEKTLDKCLSSLKPLLEAVPSELIITDTGSTDRTIEIAQKYTNHIIHFEWCGDFSAARNTGLKEARGEWFLFLDGDEWFEDVSEIAEFFTSGECDQYWTAAYIQRNYSDFGGKTYSDFHACRIFRIHNGIHFENKVHESIPVVAPTKFFKSYVNHFGYLYRNSDVKDTKMDRNFKLLQAQLKEHPDDLKSYCQLCMQEVAQKKYYQAIECAEKVLPIAEQDSPKQWRLLLTLCMIKAYYSLGKYQEAIDTEEQFAARFPQPEIFHLEYLWYAQMAAFQLKQYSKAVDFGDQYLSLYQQYRQHKLDELMLLYGDFEFLGPETEQNVRVMLGWSYFMQNQTDQALESIRQINWSVGFNRKNAFKLIFTIMDRTGEFNLLPELYQKILRLKDPKLKFEFTSYVESVSTEGTKKCEKIVRSFASLKPKAEDDYLVLERIRAAEMDGERQTVVENLNWFRQNETSWNVNFADVIYISMLEQVNIMPYLLQIDTDDVASFASRMQFDHFYYSKTVSDYFDAFSYNNAKGLYWTVALMERAVLSKKRMEDEEGYLKLFESYARQLARYVRMICRPEMFSAQNLPALSRVFRFGYSIGEAFTSLDKGDEIAYLAGLRKSLEEYPIMKEPITLLLNRFMKEQKQQDAKGKEFASLAIQAKKQIEEMIRDGNLAQAGKLTLQLAKLLPKDKDVLRFRKLTHTEPTMREIASCLPQ